MSSESASSATSSATTPPANPAKRPEPRTELDYLQQQAEQAREAIARTLHEIGAGMGHSVDVRAWTAEHPWAALSSAAVAGFATIAIVVPNKRQRALRRLAEIERALETPEPVAKTDQTDAQSRVFEPKPGFGSMLLRELAKTIIGLGIGAASTAVANFTESHNGSPADTEAAEHS